jgi:hypothetical protein
MVLDDGNKAKMLLSIVGLAIFVSVTLIFFFMLYESNLIHFRAADEGVWLDSEIDRSEWGLIPRLVKRLAGSEQSLFSARMLSLVAMWLAFAIVAHEQVKNYEYLSMIAMLPVPLTLIWLHPQVLQCSCRASSACFSILALSLSLAGYHRLLHAFKFSNWALAIGGLLLLSISTPYGWSLGTALTLAFLIFGEGDRRNKLILVLMPGLLASNLTLMFETSQFSPKNVFGNYFSSWLSTKPTDFGLSAMFRIIPFENTSGSIITWTNRIILLIVLALIALPKCSRQSKFQALSLVLFLVIHFMCEYFVDVPTIHYYLLSPIIFSLLTLPIVSATKPKSLMIATGVLALVTVPSLNRQQFNDQQNSLQHTARIANQSNRNGEKIVFCGTILYHAVYPWLDSATRQNAKLCHSGAGFFWDKYFSGNQIDQSRRVTSDCLINSVPKKTLILSSSHGQGLRVDIPSSWKKKTSYYIFGDPEIEMLYVTEASPK